MDYRKIVLSVGLVAAVLAAPSMASAQYRGRAVPRGSARAVPPPARVLPSRPLYARPYYYRPYYYRPYYAPYSTFGFYSGFGYPYYGFGFGIGFGPYPYGAPYWGGYGYGYPGYGYPGYGVGYTTSVGRPYGGVRIDLPQRNAEVYADGYFAGTVNDFDGKMQQLNLEPGPHRIEVRDPGFETITFEINVDVGRTVTYRSSMNPAQP